MEQPLAESPTREGKRTAASRSYGTPQEDLTHMLEGDVPQESDDDVVYRYQKTEGLNTMTERFTQSLFY